LRAGVLSALGLGLDDLLRWRAQSALGATGTGSPRARSCILIWLAGGPSHIDTFDPKPNAPADVRGEFKTINTPVPGLKISEVFPEIARRMDQVTLIRALTSPEADHDRATHHLLTGYRPTPALVYPSYGSVVARVRGSNDSTFVPYVAIPTAPIFASSGYLTPAYDPFEVRGDPSAENFRVRDLTPPDRLTFDRLRRRRTMVHKLDEFARDVPPTALTDSRDRFADQAYDLLTSAAAQTSFRIDTESDATRDRYGRNPLGQACLLARRLVEAGVAFVTVNDRGMGQLGWDTHQQNFRTIKDALAPPIDRAVAALLADLTERGLIGDTLIVMMGEFGRTPRINRNAGRDHHSRANWALLAGAGMPRGLVLGRTDAQGDSPVDRPTTPADLAAALYLALGIDPDRHFESPDGRPIRLVTDGRAPAELV
jgi:hypothetical protein